MSFPGLDRKVSMNVARIYVRTACAVERRLMNCEIAGRLWLHAQERKGRYRLLESVSIQANDTMMCKF